MEEVKTELARNIKLRMQKLGVLPKVKISKTRTFENFKRRYRNPLINVTTMV